MRDRHRLKEKYEVVLDGKQMRGLLVGMCLALGAVFAAGLYLGRTWVPASTQAAGEAPPVNPLAALDEQTQRLEEVRADAALTFQDELTRQRPPSLPAEEPARRVVVQSAPGGEPGGVVAGTPSPPPEPSPAQQRPLHDRPAEQATPTRMNSGENAMKEALARAQRRIPETSPNGTLTLQLTASQSRAEAERFAGNLRDKGYAPYIVEAEVPGKGTFFRVRMGRFSSKDAAQKYLQDFRRETQIDAFITPN